MTLSVGRQERQRDVASAGAALLALELAAGASG